MLNDEIRTIMSQDTLVAHPEDTIQDLAEMMIKNNYNQLPVVRDGKLVGMITTYDLWKDARHQGHDHSVQVKDVMNTHVIKLAPKDKLGTAAELFMDKRFKTLPVVNLDGELKGVVTAFDVIKSVMKKEYPTAILYGDVLNS